MLKKLLSFSLAGFILISLAACSAASGTQETKKEEQTQQETDADKQNSEDETKTDDTSDSAKDAAQNDDTASNNAVSNEKAKGSVENGQQYTCVIDVENYGPITLVLDEGIAPITVQNFKKLADEGFYNGLTFHRIIDGFMIQGGDPKGNGTGGSSENIYGEFSANGFDNTLKHEKGVISMARSQLKNSASSQFFICEEDAPSLDGQYAAFGWVTDGMDIVEQIAEDAKPTDNNGSIAKEDQPVINSITVTPIEKTE